MWRLQTCILLKNVFLISATYADMLGWLNVVYKTAVEQSQSTFHFNYHDTPLPTHVSCYPPPCSQSRIAYISVLVKLMASPTTASLQSNGQVLLKF